LILALSRFRVKNGLGSQVRAAFEQGAHLDGRMESAPGFLGLEVFCEAADPAAFMRITRWSDEAAFRAWHASPEHQLAHALIPGGLELDPQGTELIVAERIDCGAEGEVGDRRALQDQLFALNADLAVLNRENARRVAELERAHRRLEAGHSALEAAHRALEAGHRVVEPAYRELRDNHWHLEKLAEVLPMCVECRKVETAAEVWETVESYLARSSTFLSHGYCTSCAARVSAELDRDAER